MALLLETVIGFGIFVLCLLFVFGVFPMAHRSVTLARNHSLANDLARDGLERALSLGYDAIVAAPPVPFMAPVQVDGRAIEIPFEMELQVELVEPPISDYPRKNLRSIVRWPEGSVTKEVVLETWVVE